MNNDNDDAPFVTDGKEFFVLFNTPLVRGYMPVPIPKADPVLRWSGPKIDLVKSWYPALRFMQVYANHEVVLRFFMSRNKETIHIFPLTQIYGTGMSVKEEITKEERDWWAGEGMIEAGTLHSHCTSPAFASGTDKDDEKNRDGLHLTVGKLKSDQFDLHSRMVWTVPGEEKDGKVIRASSVTVQKPNLMDWFIFPSHIETFIAMEPELEESVVKYVLCKPPGKTIGYPKSWDEKLKVRPVVDWSKDKHHTYDPTRVAYPGVQGKLSMADDIPDMNYPPLKKKDNGQTSQEESEKEILKAKEATIWDCWNEVMMMIASDPVLARGQVRVSQFAPHTRGTLFAQHHRAAELWVDILRMLKANNLSEKDFFDSWGGEVPFSY
jgi:hypothetical protein